MLDIMQTNLPYEDRYFWRDIGANVQKRINGVVNVLYDIDSKQIIIKVFIEEFNFGLYCDFQPNLKEYLNDKTIIQCILHKIQVMIYKKVFRKENNNEM